MPRTLIKDNPIGTVATDAESIVTCAGIDGRTVRRQCDGIVAPRPHQLGRIGDLCAIPPRPIGEQDLLNTVRPVELALKPQHFGGRFNLDEQIIAALAKAYVRSV
ncbi:hypothetical protein ACVWZV_006009 [Bradyrhizobium sp. GM5.1]